MYESWRAGETGGQLINGGGSGGGGGGGRGGGVVSGDGGAVGGCLWAVLKEETTLCSGTATALTLDESAAVSINPG